VIFKTQLFGLPGSLWTQGSYSKIPNSPIESLSPRIQEFQKHLIDPQVKNQEKLELFKILIADNTLNNQHKFQALQNILDYLQADKNINIKCPERTYSTSDGWFYFTDLQTGFYQLEASLPLAGMRYANAAIKVEISDINFSGKSNPNSSFSDRLRLILKLNPTTLLGKVIDSETKELVDMAKVKIHDDKDYTISSRIVNQDEYREWNYRLVGLEASNPFTTLTVSAQGYVTQEHQVYLQTGDLQQLDFQLVSQ
jgi:hypothetical protein